MSKNPVVIQPQPGKQTLAMNVKADVIIYGGSAGSGKSHLLLMHPLKHCLKDPNFNGIFFRRVTKQLIGAGGLWPESGKMYKPFKAKEKLQTLTRAFPCGATLQFAHMEHEKNCEDHQGLQYSAVYFDSNICRFT